jgi:hypothetical protein
MNHELIKRYDSIRSQIPNGSILLVRGASALSKTIQWADNAYYNHSALVFTAGDRLMVLDSNEGGVKPEFASVRIGEYVDFCFLVPVGYDTKQVNNAVSFAIDKDVERNFKYDFALLPKVLMAKKLKLPIKHDLETRRSICSVFTGFHYAKLLGEFGWVKQAIDKGYLTPQDHIRFINDKWKIIDGK